MHFIMTTWFSTFSTQWFRWQVKRNVLSQQMCCAEDQSVYEMCCLKTSIYLDSLNDAVADGRAGALFKHTTILCQKNAEVFRFLWPVDPCGARASVTHRGIASMCMPHPVSKKLREQRGTHKGACWAFHGAMRIKLERKEYWGLYTICVRTCVCLFHTQGVS